MKFLIIEEVIEINKEAILKYGGLYGLRDKNLLEGALMNPQNLFYYKNSDIFELASSYAVSIVKNHPFLDGNKRTGFGAMDLFLRLNNVYLKFTIEETIEVFIKIATGEVKIKELEKWLANLKTRAPTHGVV